MAEPALQSQKYSHEGPDTAAPPAGVLEQRIDELLQDISDAASQLGASLQTAPTPPTPDSPPPEKSIDLESSLDQVIEEARQRTTTAGDPPKDASPAAVQQIDEALAKRAGEVMKEEPPPPAPESTAPDETAHGVTLSMSDTAENDVPREAAPTEPAPDDLVTILAAPPPAPVEPPRPAQRRLALRWLVAPFAWPLSFLSPAMRDIVGWFGLVTLFNAACIWAYLLLH